MKQQQVYKKLSLIDLYNNQYIGSDLQKIVSHNPLPIKYTINGTDCYFYNADLFGLFDVKFKGENGITPDDFATDYKEGFEKGLKHLKNDLKITVKSYQNNNRKDAIIQQLKNLLHEREFVLNKKGLLEAVFNTIPLIWTDKNIHEVGYRNGIIYSIDRFGEKVGVQIFKELTNNKKAKPLELSDFLNNEDYRNMLTKIKDKFENSTGVEMAKAIYLLDSMDILCYDYHSKTKGRKQLATLLNPNVNMNGVNKYFTPNTKNTEITDTDLNQLREWFSGL